jgi:hypothetical protein
MQETDRRRTVRLGDFALASLESHGALRGIGVSALVCQAVSYYLGDRGSARPGWLLPRFRAGEEDGGPASELSVTLSEHEWSMLVDEAKVRRAKVDRLLEHAALYYLADLDGGRIPPPMVPATNEGVEEEASP